MMEMFEERSKVQNFALRKEISCMECGKNFLVGKGLYERRFCSEDCKLRYLI